ncbi:MAG: DUF1254 domain-containing protein [Acidobacteriota bacterium]
MTNQQISEQQAYEIGVEAYVYLYPLILTDITRRLAINVEPGKRPGMGPMNDFSHMREFPPASFREVVRPNFDTLYSIAWLDLTKEPMAVSVPDTQGRYYLLPLLDMWTDAFAVPGKQTTGTSAMNFVVVPQGWTGSLPTGFQRIEAPTPYVWVIGRTQTNGPKDYDAVHRIQDGFAITPLSKWGKKIQPAKVVIDPTVDMKTPPVVQINSMPAAKYFGYGAELMKLHPPHVTDWSIVARMKRMGIEPGKSFDFDHASPTVKESMQRAAVNGLKLMQEKVPTLARVVNGWAMSTDTIGVYGNFYLKRAAIAMVGLGANQPEDAIYPMCVTDSDGNPMDGGRTYVLHFGKDELPPVGAFWSVTMYDAEGFMAPNKLDRFALGDRDELRFNADGSLDIYIQHESPGADKESNWLPSPPKGTLSVTMRLYAPKAQVLDGRWAPPAIKKTGQDVSRKVTAGR